MGTYIHGAYGSINTAGSKVASASRNVFVYVGTAPVNTVEGGSTNVNKPVLVSNIAEAKKLFGYSDDFASFTLCEAMKCHLDMNGVGPIVLINVMDPSTHKETAAVTASVTPSNGRAIVTNAELAVLDTVVVKKDSKTLVKGTDYNISYSSDKKIITIQEIGSGTLGTAALSVTYNKVKPSEVTSEDVIGSTDGTGVNKGLYGIMDVYQETGYIPSFLLAPGFSSDPAVHKIMLSVASKVNGHWDAYILADIPLTNSESETITLATAEAWKSSNGYNNERETVYFPMAAGTDGLYYHLSVLAAANLQKLLVAQDGIPYKTASNTSCDVIESLWFGDANVRRVVDDQMVNTYLCQHGIASAAYVGGRWVIWGCHGADYEYGDASLINVSETNRMMLYYISNDFQERRMANVDKPMTVNDLKTIVSEEQTRLDALVKIGALTYGEVSLDATVSSSSDVANGDYQFAFTVTTTPLAKSLTAVVTWSDEGFSTYFEQLSV